MGGLNATFDNMTMQVSNHHLITSLRLNSLSVVCFHFQPDVNRSINLLQERLLIPPTGVESSKPELHHDFKKVNTNPEYVPSL